MIYILRSYTFTVICSFLFLSQTADAQDPLEQSYTQVFASFGYSQSALSDPRAYIDEIIGFYNINNIPITKQCDFGKTLSIEAGILFSDSRRFERMRFGVCLGYIYSPAYANYKDNTGTVDVNGSVNSFQAFLVYHKILYETDKTELFFRFKPGIDYSELKISDDQRIINSPELNYHSEVNANGYGFFGEATCGVFLKFSSYHCSLEGGYRLLDLNAEGTMEPETPDNKSRIFTFNISQSGIVFLFSVGFNL